MNRSRNNLENRLPISTRLTRSSATQARQVQTVQTENPSPSTTRTLQKKQTDSVLAQNLSQMSVTGQKAMPASSSINSQQQRAKASGSQSTQSSPAGHELKSTYRGALASVARLIQLGRCKNVVVVAGAGISTASGIPDFRTPGTGLYANLKKYNIPYPEAVFNIEYFSNDPRPFFSLAKELYPGCHRPNYIHYFIRMLHQKGLLLRMYTQNIDGLEKKCGIPDEKLVEAHGSFATASCHLCYTPFPSQEAKSAIMSNNTPVCTFCAGTVKPDIVFFGEDLPEKYFLHSKDFPKTDLLIIMGTSLQIEPFASLINTVRSNVPRLLLNRDPVGPFLKVPLRRGDHMELGDLVDKVRKFAEILGWHSEIEELMMSQENGNLASLVCNRPQSTSEQKPDQCKANSLGKQCDSQPEGQLSQRSKPGAFEYIGSSSGIVVADYDDRMSTDSSIPNN